MQGARCGTQSQVSRITPWAKGGAKPLSHQGRPVKQFFNRFMALSGEQCYCHFKMPFRMLQEPTSLKPGGWGPLPAL